MMSKTRTKAQCRHFRARREFTRFVKAFRRNRQLHMEFRHVSLIEFAPTKGALSTEERNEIYRVAFYPTLYS